MELYFKWDFILKMFKIILILILKDVLNGTLFQMELYFKDV